MHRMSGTGDLAKRRGFTLIEMMVVLAILVLMASAIPLALNRTVPKLRLAKAMQQVTLCIREARTQSMALNRPVRLRFDDHVVSSESTLHVRGVSNVTIPAEMKFSAVDLSGRPLTQLEIYPDGATNGAKIELAEGTRKSSLVISALTGQLTVSTGTWNEDRS